MQRRKFCDNQRKTVHKRTLEQFLFIPILPSLLPRITLNVDILSVTRMVLIEPLNEVNISRLCETRGALRLGFSQFYTER